MGYHEWPDRPGYCRDVTKHFSSTDRLRDIGCGTAWMAEDFEHYCGVETSREALGLAEERRVDVREVRPNGSLPFEDSDGVVLMDVLGKR